MANADPSGVGTHVRDRDAAQVSADCTAHQQVSLVVRDQVYLTSWVRKSALFDGLLVSDLLLGQSSDENGSAVPDDLQDLSWREFSDIELGVCISVVPGPTVQSADDRDCEESSVGDETSIEHGVEDVHVSSSHICLVFVEGSVLLEPVVHIDLEVDVFSKIARTSRRVVESRSFVDRMSARGHLHVAPLLPLLQEREVSSKAGSSLTSQQSCDHEIIRISLQVVQ